MGYIFPPTISPDYGFAFESLVELERVVFYDKSLTVGLGLKTSNGAAFSTGRFNEAKAREFIDLYEKSGRQFKFKRPLPEIMIPANAIVHEYVSLIERHEDIVLSEVNRGTYLKHMFHSVKGVEDRELRNQYTKILQRAGYQETTWEMLKGAVRRLKEWINKGNNRTFESIDEAIEYSYHNYPQPVADRRHAH